MKNHIKGIVINKPCNEQWNEMDNISDGKFCKSCQKKVVDFSMLSNKEILDYLSDENKVCGKFDKKQFDNLNASFSVANITKAKFENWRFAALFLGATTLFAPMAKATFTHRYQQESIKNYQSLKDSTVFYTISGKVTDENGLAVPGATVIVEGANAKTTTNIEGAFALTVPSNTKHLLIKYIGYEIKEIRIRPKKRTKYSISLEASKFVLGEGAVIRDHKIDSRLSVRNIIKKISFFFT